VVLLSLISEDNMFYSVVCSYPITHTSGVSLRVGVAVIVLLTEDPNLYPDDPLITIFTTLITLHDTTCPIPSGIIPGSLGPNGPFCAKLFHHQSQQLAQLRTANNVLEA